MKRNKAAGDAYEREIFDEISSDINNTNVVQQVTVKNQSGVRTRIDIMYNDVNTGVIKCVECKASETAPLTKNQEKAFPEIAQTGATVVGKGKYPFTGGTIIPPTDIEIMRKK